MSNPKIYISSEIAVNDSNAAGASSVGGYNGMNGQIMNCDFKLYIVVTKEDDVHKDQDYKTYIRYRGGQIGKSRVADSNNTTGHTWNLRGFFGTSDFATSVKVGTNYPQVTRGSAQPLGDPMYGTFTHNQGTIDGVNYGSMWCYVPDQIPSDLDLSKDASFDPTGWIQVPSIKTWNKDNSLKELSFYGAWQWYFNSNVDNAQTSNSAKITIYGGSGSGFEVLFEYYPWERRIDNNWYSLNREGPDSTSAGLFKKSGAWNKALNIEGDADQSHGFRYNNGWQISPKTGEGAQ